MSFYLATVFGTVFIGYGVWCNIRRRQMVKCFEWSIENSASLEDQALFAAAMRRKETQIREATLGLAFCISFILGLWTGEVWL